MQALDEVRAEEISMDMELQPIEECYAFLSRCGVAVPREEVERVDSLRYTFKNLLSQAVCVCVCVCVCVWGMCVRDSVPPFPAECCTV